MTSPFALTPLTLEQAFRCLNPGVRMWIQLKSHQIASVGRFGPCELSALTQEMKTRFGPAASAGNPPLMEVAVHQVLQRMRQELASAGGDAPPASLELQRQLQHQTMMMQLLSNVLKTRHETVTNAISNIGR